MQSKLNFIHCRKVLRNWSKRRKKRLQLHFDALTSKWLLLLPSWRRLGFRSLEGSEKKRIKAVSQRFHSYKTKKSKQSNFSLELCTVPPVMTVFTYDLNTRRSYCDHECLILLSFLCFGFLRLWWSIPFVCSVQWTNIDCVEAIFNKPGHSWWQLGSVQGCHTWWWSRWIEIFSFHCTSMSFVIQTLFFKYHNW